MQSKWKEVGLFHATVADRGCRNGLGSFEVVRQLLIRLYNANTPRNGHTSKFVIFRRAAHDLITVEGLAENGDGLDTCLWKKFSVAFKT